MNLRNVLSYDKESGSFTWLTDTRMSKRAGREAGYVSAQGYLVIRIGAKALLAHRLALEFSGVDVSGNQVDHINCNRLDNRLCNLRVVDAVANGQNRRRASIRNKLGVLGVCELKGKFVAQIRHSGKNEVIGRYASIQQASDAYIARKREVHPGGTL